MEHFSIYLKSFGQQSGGSKNSTTKYKLLAEIQQFTERIIDTGTDVNAGTNANANTAAESKKVEKNIEMTFVMVKPIDLALNPLVVTGNNTDIDPNENITDPAKWLGYNGPQYSHM